MKSLNTKIKNRKSKIARLVPPLLEWFSKEARNLPWRRTRDPYAIWVSEIMLQQTQVKTVIPYWERWMHALPDIQSLADAKSETIHKLWEGLGYYTRVRNMQKAAREIVEEHGGNFPRHFDDILALPGIGRYTAGAISSIAFNEPRPILDGNVIRVLTRLFGITGNPRERTVNEQLWQLAQAMVNAASFQLSSSRRKETLIKIRESREIRVSLRRLLREENRYCSHLNQSVMELGALVCTPKQPLCKLCPVRSHCVAHRTNKVELLPNLGTRPKTTSRHFVAFVIERRGRFLVRQRPADVVNAHLWEFPNTEVNDDKFTASSLAKSRLGFAPDGLSRIATVKHSITRYRMTLEAYRGRSDSVAGKVISPDRWIRRDQLDALPFASAHRRILQHLTRT